MYPNSLQQKFRLAAEIRKRCFVITAVSKYWGCRMLRNLRLCSILVHDRGQCCIVIVYQILVKTHSHKYLNFPQFYLNVESLLRKPFFQKIFSTYLIHKQFFYIFKLQIVKGVVTAKINSKLITSYPNSFKHKLLKSGGYNFKQACYLKVKMTSQFKDSNCSFIANYV